MASSENLTPHHHRSKSQLARSILNRVSSRRDDTSEAGDTAGRSSMASESNVSVASTSRSSRHRPHLSTTMSPQAALDVNSRNKGSVDSSPVAETAVSLDQSVRMFRYFEALRHGDTSAIAKALKEQETRSPNKISGTSILHLAIQCAEISVIEFIISNLSADGKIAEINDKDKDGNTPLHLAARLGRSAVVSSLLEQPEINDSITNQKGETPLDVAYSPEIFQQLQLARSLFVDANIRQIHTLVASKDYRHLEQILKDPRIRSSLDINGTDLPTDKLTLDTGGTLLHEAARKKDDKLIELLLMNGVDPFKRDKKGKLPQDITKDERIRHLLKRSRAAEAAQRTLQEKTILGSTVTLNGPTPGPSESPLGGKESREMKGYLKKWTNYTGGWKLRWFVLEEGVLSYYKHQGL
jgi:hypothetical protein